MIPKQGMDIRTTCAQGTEVEHPGRPIAPPIVASSTFLFEDQAGVEEYYATGRGWLYSRYGSPTVRAAEALLAALEGAEDAALFASGLAAISTTLLTLVRSGGRIAAQRELYGGTWHMLTHVLPDFGISTLWLDRADLDSLEPARLRDCDVLLLETPTNPTLRVVDLARSSAVAHEAGIPAVVDGTFATPVFQRALALGCDLVVHSGTKYLGGHSDLTAGAVAGRAETIRRIAGRRRDLGSILDPFQAFLLHRGMRTLAVRMEAHARGARAVAAPSAPRPRQRRARPAATRPLTSALIPRRRSSWLPQRSGSRTSASRSAHSRIDDEPSVDAPLERPSIGLALDPCRAVLRVLCIDVLEKLHRFAAGALDRVAHAVQTKNTRPIARAE